jgi:hypothetical protein
LLGVELFTTGALLVTVVCGLGLGLSEDPAELPELLDEDDELLALGEGVEVDEPEVEVTLVTSPPPETSTALESEPALGCSAAIAVPLRPATTQMPDTIDATSVIARGRRERRMARRRRAATRETCMGPLTASFRPASTAFAGPRVCSDDPPKPTLPDYRYDRSRMVTATRRKLENRCPERDIPRSLRVRQDPPWSVSTKTTSMAV